MKCKRILKSLAQCAVCSAAAFAHIADATIVQFQTSLGDFEVNLYDDSTPETVANFLAYLEAGTYSSTFIHRSMPGFIIQGGGFFVDEENVVQPRESLWSPINEPVFSNVAGTIAMAKLGNDPNSATNQWFFNLADNSDSGAKLDVQNGGFTVFGEVIGDGMTVVNAIAAVPRYAVNSGVFSSTPLREFDAESDREDFMANPMDYLVVINDVVVLDAAADTAAELSPLPNTLINAKKKKSGPIGWMAIFALAALAAVRVQRHRGRRSAV